MARLSHYALAIMTTAAFSVNMHLIKVDVELSIWILIESGRQIFLFSSWIGAQLPAYLLHADIARPTAAVRLQLSYLGIAAQDTNKQLDS